MIQQDRGEYVPLSRLFLYYNARVFLGSSRGDSGSHPEHALITLSQIGICADKLWPYDEGRFTVRPSTEAFTDAWTRRITSYANLGTIDEVTSNLADGYPLIIAFNVYETWDKVTVENGSYIPMPKKNERTAYRHAALVVGYDLDWGMAIVRNSWGRKWGDLGYCYMPFEFLMDQKYTQEIWSFRL